MDEFITFNNVMKRVAYLSHWVTHAVGTLIIIYIDI